MRELNNEEMEQVVGGVLPLPPFYGDIAGAMTKFQLRNERVGFVPTYTTNSTVTGSGTGQTDIGDFEKVLEK